MRLRKKKENKFGDSHKNGIWLCLITRTCEYNKENLLYSQVLVIRQSQITLLQFSC